MMPQTIWKFPVAALDYQEVLMPAGARILSVAEQRGEIVLYAICDPGANLESRRVWIVGTGHPVPEAALKAVFLGTVSLDGGALMFHMFRL